MLNETYSHPDCWRSSGYDSSKFVIILQTHLAKGDLPESAFIDFGIY